MHPSNAAGAGVTPQFDEIGAHYDRLTGLSPGYTRQLDSSARLLLGLLTAGGPVRDSGSLGQGAASRAPSGAAARTLRVADIGCGSGLSTQALVRALTASGRPFEVEGIDGSAGMLDQARRKTWPPGVTFRHAAAEDLGAEDLLAQGPRYDAVFAAYLVRNVSDRDALLAAIHAMLRPGGYLLVHDYGVAGRPLDVLAWTALSWGVIIPTAWVVTRRPRLFTYLWRSVLAFDSDEALRARITAAGFDDVGQRPVAGWQRGMVRATWGRRP